MEASELLGTYIGSQSLIDNLCKASPVNAAALRVLSYSYASGKKLCRLHTLDGHIDTVWREVPGPSYQAWHAMLSCVEYTAAQLGLVITSCNDDNVYGEVFFSVKPKEY